jgi:hypothetical protein
MLARWRPCCEYKRPFYGLVVNGARETFRACHNCNLHCRTTTSDSLIVDSIGCGGVSGGDEGHGAAVQWALMDRLG